MREILSSTVQGKALLMKIACTK